MEKNTYHFVLNTRSGTAQSLGLTADSLKAMLDSAGYDAVVDADEDASFEERIERAKSSPCKVIVAAGGDGTASSLAAALLGTDKILAVLPVGTVNSLARDLRVPLDIPTWISALGDMVPRRIDVAEVNGRIFLHMVVIGVAAGMAAGREMLRDRSDLAARLGLVRYYIRRLSRAKRLAVHINPSDAESRVERVQAIAIAVNPYEEGLGRIMSRQQLDGGELALYVVRHLTLLDAIRLAAEMLLGRWQDDHALAIQSVPAVTITSHKPRLQAMIDGEVESLEVPLEFRIRPQALHVLAVPDPEVLDEAQPQLA